MPPHASIQPSIHPDTSGNKNKINILFLLKKLKRSVELSVKIFSKEPFFVCLSPGGESLGLDLLEFPTSSGLRDGYMGHVPDIQ